MRRVTAINPETISGESNSAGTIRLRRTNYHHPDVQLLVAQVQQEYVRRYGSQDSSPIDKAEFDPPNGMFVIATVDGRPAAMGGWRRLDSLQLDPATGQRGSPALGTAEIRRMYVSPEFRGRGLARAVLAELESTARDRGCGKLILETGLPQPEALALYRSSGYRDVPPFGHYAGSPLSVPLGKEL
jgi:GNAT superfamily N-acetyltransferase